MLRMTVEDTARLLLIASTIGVVDVFWFHLHRFRLYRQAACVAEEVTHLASYAVFVALAVALLGVRDGGGTGLVVVLFGVQLALTVADVLLEPRSRAPLGGLPAVEYLFHVLVTFGIGGAAATFWWSTRGSTPAPLEGMARAQVAMSAAFTAVLLIVEGTLFLRSIARRRGPHVSLA